MIILGSGLAGLIACYLNRESRIFESAQEPKNHNAILRFRSPAIGEAVGIPFKQVKVYKGIWHNDKPVELSPRYITLYSRKVSDTIAYRSISNLETENRWIAPDNFQEQLRDMLYDRIHYGCNLIDVKRYQNDEPIISTIPMFVLANLYDQQIECLEDKTQQIYVSRYEIPHCNVYMTYYYTDPTIKIYRASITGNILIIESMWKIQFEDLKMVKRSFGIHGIILNPIIENYQQTMGKIVPMDESIRKNFILKMTLKHKIFSLGRYATWRNLVLDDVYKDVLKIKGMLNNIQYEAFLKIHES